MDYTKCFLCLTDEPGRGLKLTSDDACSFILYNILELPTFDSVQKKSKLLTVTYCQGCSEEISGLREMLDDLEDLEKKILRTKKEMESKLIGSCENMKKTKQQGSLYGGLSLDHPVDQFRSEIVNELKSSNIQSILTKMRDSQLAKKFQKPRNSILFNNNSSIGTAVTSEPAPEETDHTSHISTVFNVNPTTSAESSGQKSKLRSRGIHILKNVTIPRVSSTRLQQQNFQKMSSSVPSCSDPRTSGSGISSRLRRRLQSQDTMSNAASVSSSNPGRSRNNKRRTPVPDMALNYPNYNFVPEDEGEPGLTMPLLTTFSGEPLRGEIIASASNTLLSQNPCETVSQFTEESQLFSLTAEHPKYESVPPYNVKMEHFQQEQEEYVPIDSLIPGVVCHEGMGKFEQHGSTQFTPDDNSVLGFQSPSELSARHLDNILPHPVLPPLSPPRKRGRRVVRIPCPTCGNIYQRHSVLKKHMQDRHPGVPIPPKSVLKKPESPDRVKSRIVIGEDGKEKWKCDECGKLFRSDSNRKYHVQKLHRGLSNVHCPICGFGLLRESHLKAHMNSKHTFVKNFKCALCSCAYKNQRMLKIHMRKHTGEKPYQCKLCPQRFIDSTFLRRHEKVNHKGYKS